MFSCYIVELATELVAGPMVEMQSPFVQRVPADKDLSSITHPAGFSTSSGCCSGAVIVA